MYGVRERKEGGGKEGGEGGGKGRGGGEGGVKEEEDEEERKEGEERVGTGQRIVKSTYVCTSCTG